MTQYNTALAAYNKNYPKNKSLTLAELTAQAATYKSASDDYSVKLKDYNRMYPNERRTTAQLLTLRNTSENAFKALNDPYVVANTSYELALTTYTTQKNAYDTSYPTTNTIMSAVLSQQYEAGLAPITAHNQSVIILRDLRITQGSLTAIKNQLEAQRATLDQEIADMRVAMQNCVPK